MIESLDDLVEYSPLTKTFTFNAYLVSGYTPISKGSKLDYDINRLVITSYSIHYTKLYDC